MKLINLIPLREADEMNPELIATPYFRQFQTTHGYKPLFKYIGKKSDQDIFIAEVTDFGAIDLIMKDAQIVAKITDKEAVFGMVYTLTGLEKSDATICKMKQKDNVVEVIPFDNTDKKNFDAKTTKFLGIIDEAK
jgi:hypothetical protein